MLSNMACSLIKHKRIFTTTAKAKALRKYVEPLITKSKEDTTHSRRVVFSNLQDKFAVTELFKEIAQKIGDRPGGYTRLQRLLRLLQLKQLARKKQLNKQVFYNHIRKAIRITRIAFFVY